MFKSVACLFSLGLAQTDNQRMPTLHHKIFLLVSLSVLTACVPPRKLEETKAQLVTATADMEQQRTRAVAAEASLNEQQGELDELRKRNSRLATDTAVLASSLRHQTRQYDKINALNDELLNKYNKLLSGDKSENRKLLTALESLRLQQQNNQDSLMRLRREAEMRGERLKELEGELAQKDQAMADLKARVKNALSGFEGKGLTIEEKNGKLYVSLENKLLFPSGSADVDSKGSQALQDLAKAIENETDLEILVEGHTDTDQMRAGSKYADNWDLSVARAVSVVRILRSSSKVDPARITAAGRSEFLPIDPSDKSKNRRIEVILAPDLSSLFELVR